MILKETPKSSILLNWRLNYALRKKTKGLGSQRLVAYLLLISENSEEGFICGQAVTFLSQGFRRDRCTVDRRRGTFFRHHGRVARGEGRMVCKFYGSGALIRFLI